MAVSYNRYGLVMIVETDASSKRSFSSDFFSVAALAASSEPNRIVVLK